MKKDKNKMSTGRKTKRKSKEEPVLSTLGDDIEEPEVSTLGDDVERPAVVKVEIEEPEVKKADICGCGGTKESGIVYLCPACGRTWCSLCRRTLTACPVCETQGV